MKSVSVIVPSWDGEEMLAQTLPPLLLQEGVDFEVIVVDNGSRTDATKQLVYELQKSNEHLRLVTLKQNAGFTGAINSGVQEARHSLVAVLGNDNIVELNWLRTLVDLWGSGECPVSGKLIGAVMSQSIVNHQIPYGPCSLNLFGRNIFYRDEKWEAEDFFTFYPGGNAFLFDKATYDLPFADFYFVYHEDVSLGWRIQNRGSLVLQSHGPYVHSFDGGTTKRKSQRFNTYMYTERNRWINLLTFPEASTIAKVWWLWALDLCLTLIFSSNRLPKLVALFWLIRNTRLIGTLRDRRQQERTVADTEALRFMSPDYFSLAANPYSLAASFKRGFNVILRVYWKLMGLDTMGSGLRCEARKKRP